MQRNLPKHFFEKPIITRNIYLLNLKVYKIFMYKAFLSTEAELQNWPIVVPNFSH